MSLADTLEVTKWYHAIELLWLRINYGSLSCTVFEILDFEEHCDLPIRVRGHLRSLKVVRMPEWVSLLKIVSLGWCPPI